jgi:hypothetical protein
MPVLRVGHLPRVPRHQLEELVGGPVTWPIPDEPAEAITPTPATAIDIQPRSVRRWLAGC